jgi:hypothetical protein
MTKPTLTLKGWATKRGKSEKLAPGEQPEYTVSFTMDQATEIVLKGRMILKSPDATLYSVFGTKSELEIKISAIDQRKLLDQT